MKILFLITICFTLSIFSQNKTLSLNDAISIGLSNSKILVIAESKVNLQKAKVWESSSLMLPQLKLNASYSLLSEVPPFEIKLPTMPSPITLQEPITNAYVLRLGIQQPIFTGFRLLSQKSMNDYNRESSEYEYVNEINEEAAKIVSAYLNFYKSLKLKILFENNFKLIDKHLYNTNEFLKNGMASKSDVLKLEVQKSNIKIKMIEATNMVDINRSLLNKTIGIDISEFTLIDTVLNISINRQYDFADIFEQAISNRNDIKSMNSKLNAVSKLASISKAGYYPNIYLSSNYYYNRPNQRIFPNRDQFDDTWDIGISLSWDIWNWGQTSAQVTQANETFKQTENLNKLLVESIKIEVLNNYLTLNSSLEKIKAAETSIESAKENYRIISEKYSVQLATSTDLIEASNLLLQAETEYMNSLVDLEIAGMKLDKSIGKKLYNSYE